MTAADPVFSGGASGGFEAGSAGESSADTDAEIRFLRAAGRTHRQICDALGVSKGRVARVLGSAPVAGRAKFDASSASGSWVCLAEYDPPGGSVPPSLIRFPNGETHGLHRWNDVLVSVAEWLSATGQLTVSNTPVVASRPGTYIVHDQPVHPLGKHFPSTGRLMAAGWQSTSTALPSSCEAELASCSSAAASVLTLCTCKLGRQPAADVEPATAAAEGAAWRSTREAGT